MSTTGAREQLARRIDHTLLRPEATAAEVARLCAEATVLGVHAVCVSPTLVRVAAAATGPSVAVASVCGFPSGAHDARVKAREAAIAVADGADEIDVVLNLGLVASGDLTGVETEIAEVVAAAGPALVKVIIESAVLTEEQIVGSCLAAVAAGAGFVKTSTGFHPAGGATVDAVALMRRSVGGGIGVKASGGIRTAQAALAMLDAGASRLGCSATAAVLAEVG